MKTKHTQTISNPVSLENTYTLGDCFIDSDTGTLYMICQTAPSTVVAILISGGTSIGNRNTDPIKVLSTPGGLKLTESDLERLLGSVYDGARQVKSLNISVEL